MKNNGKRDSYLLALQNIVTIYLSQAFISSALMPLCLKSTMLLKLYSNYSLLHESRVKYFHPEVITDLLVQQST